MSQARPAIHVGDLHKRFGATQALDGVSLVTNYRASFASTIRQSGIDGLIKTLAAQSARGEATPVPRNGS